MYRIFTILVFVCLLNSIHGQEIVGIEYHIDSIPVNEDGTPLNLGQSSQQIEQTFNVDLSSIGNGVHSIYIRVKNNAGIWSLYEKKTFYVMEGFSNPEITEIEYCFDSIPANGSGTQLNLGQSASQIEQSYTIDLGAVGTGIHTLYIRTRDNQGVWSLYQKKTFYVINGLPDPEITEIEYFIDSISSNGVGSRIQINPSQNPLDFNDVIDLSGLEPGHHKIYIRTIDSNGKKSLLTSNEFGLCETGPAVANFDYTQFGFDHSFIDQSMLADEYYWDFGDGSSSTVSHPTHTFSPGEYDVCQVVTNECSVDTFCNHVSVLGIESYEPRSAGNIGDIFMNIYGGGFDDQTIITLKKEGEEDITPVNKLDFESRRLLVLFDLRNKLVGSWDIEIQFSNDSLVVIENGFEIVEGIIPNIWTDLSGRTAIRINQWQSYTIKYGNTGNVDARGVPIWLAVPQNAEIEFDFEIKQPPSNASVDFDTVDVFFMTDSVLGEPFPSKAYNFIVPHIYQNSSGSLSFNIKIPTGGTADMAIWANPPMYGSPLKPFIGECLDGLIELLVSEVPQAACALGVINQLVTPFIDVFYDDEFGSPTYVASYFHGFVSTSVDCVLATNPASTSLKLASAILNIPNYTGTVDVCVSNTVSLIDEAFAPLSHKENSISVINSFDPNEKSGPSQEYVNNRDQLNYSISFENLDSATASAQKVEILDTLDTSVFNLNSFRIGNLIVADTILKVPAGRQNFAIDFFLDSLSEAFVRINIKLDTLSGIARWQFLTVDTNTLELTDDPFAGFLPPNVIPPEGEGSVSYSVELKEGLPTGTEITNKASIIFDNNEPIITNTWANVLDDTKPESSISSLDAIQSDTSFLVEWSGTDIGSGIRNYRIYVSTNGGGFKIWKYNTTAVQDTFIGQPDSLYSFYSIAIDEVGNIEDKSPMAEASTQIIYTNVGEALNIGAPITIYPNPTNGVLYFKSNEIGLDQTLVVISNQLGEIVYEKPFEGHEINEINKIELDNVSAGVYFIKMTYKGYPYTTKFVVQR